MNGKEIDATEFIKQLNTDIEEAHKKQLKKLDNLVLRGSGEFVMVCSNCDSPGCHNGKNKCDNLKLYGSKQMKVRG